MSFRGNLDKAICIVVINQPHLTTVINKDVVLDIRENAVGLPRSEELLRRWSPCRRFPQRRRRSRLSGRLLLPGGRFAHQTFGADVLVDIGNVDHPNGLTPGYTRWEMRTSRLLLGFSSAASLVFLLASPLAAGEWPVVCKVLSILPLAVLGFRVDALLGAGLAVCALGDSLLGLRQLGSLDRAALFLLGLGSFLIAHLVYIAMFGRYRAQVWWKPGPLSTVGVVAILVALGSVLGQVRHSLGALFIPVVVYALVLCGMGVSAMLADLGNPLAAIGALLFVASDATLAISKFRGPFPGHETLIWTTYYLAQLLILLGIARRHSGEHRTP